MLQYLSMDNPCSSTRLWHRYVIHISMEASAKLGDDGIPVASPWCWQETDRNKYGEAQTAPFDNLSGGIRGDSQYQGLLFANLWGFAQGQE